MHEGNSYPNTEIGGTDQADSCQWHSPKAPPSAWSIAPGGRDLRLYRHLSAHRNDGDMTQTLQKTDAQLKEAVGHELTWTPSIDGAHIGVAVEGGAVALSGEVDSYPEKLTAEKAVLRVHGVTAVANDITVRTSWGPRHDADVAREAGDALGRAVNVPDEVKAVVKDGHITLSGPVVWQYQREAADRAVRYLKGVKGIFNDVQIRPKVSPVDLKTAITAALVRSAQLESKRIVITAEGGNVTLDGTVASWTERLQADAAAWSAPGVTAVSNRLTVRV
jgi:osmotically-inducible protein OsmY